MEKNEYLRITNKEQYANGSILETELTIYKTLKEKPYLLEILKMYESLGEASKAEFWKMYGAYKDKQTS